MNFIDAYKAKLIEVLNAFDNFCTENGLNYYASGGTAIGVARHNGFIPWDDDIDVVMPRVDFNKLISLKSKLNETHYRLKSLGDDGYNYAFGKFYDSDTTLVEVRQFPACIIGANIDIFPIDEVLDDISETEKKKNVYDGLQTKFLYTYHKLTLHSVLAHIRHGLFKELGYMFYYNLFASTQDKERDREAFIMYDQEWQKDKGSCYYNHAAFYPLRKELLHKSWFESYTYMPFEDTKIRMMKGYDKYLSQLFGDYMTPPPVEKQVMHHYQYYVNLKEGLGVLEIAQRIKEGEFCVY